MFLAPIRNHILLPFIPLTVPSCRSLSNHRLSFLPFHPSFLSLLPPCRACRVCRPRPPIVDADDIATRVFRSFPPRLPGQICLCTAFIYSTAVEPPPRIGRTTLVPCVSRESPRERANYNPRWAQLIARARPSSTLPIKASIASSRLRNPDFYSFFPPLLPLPSSLRSDQSSPTEAIFALSLLALPDPDPYFLPTLRHRILPSNCLASTVSLSVEKTNRRNLNEFGRVSRQNRFKNR